MKILGLDIGTNSIGWALVEENKSIIDCGVRIFPVGVKEDDYNKSGSEISKNVGRRMARTIRRSYFRYKLRRQALMSILEELGMMPRAELVNMPSKQLYGLRKRGLDEQISLQELGRLFLLLNQRRGFKSGKKERGTTDEKEKSKIKQEMNDLEQKVRAANCRTLGEYFYLLFLQNEDDPNCYNPEEPVQRIRARFVDRKLYNEEFDAIWDKQKHYYPDILTEANKKRIKDDCIFYQRKLKSQKHLVGFCRFEPQKRCCPISSDTFQQFRIWQVINNMRISGNGLYRESLTTDEKQLVFEAVNTREDYTEATVKTILKLNRNIKLNDLPPKLKGNTTNARIAKAIGADAYYRLTDTEREQLWHILFFAEDEDWIYNYGVKKFGFDHEQATKLAAVQLEEGYASVSSKALLKGKDKDVVDNGILFHLKNGNEYSEAARLAGYHHSYDAGANDPDRVLVDKVVINEKDRLKNPLVQQCISECARLVNAIIKEHGRPDMIRIEMARSLKKPKSEREQAKRKNDEKERRRDIYKEFLKRELKKEYISKAELIKFELYLEMGYSETELKKLNNNIDVEEFKKFSRRVNSNDKKKYELWLECGRISPYTGKIISLSKLFSSEIDIEHIVPYSRCMNDSFINKTLCEREINDDKGNKTPYEYLGSNPDAWREFKERIKDFSEAKQKQFTMQELPDDFLNSQLTNTAYIAREVVSHFKKVCKKVTVTNGQATSLLRKFWGLNELLNPDRENEKSRLDHRHHTIDAIVVACTSDAYIQKLSKESQFDGYGRIRVENVKFPYPSFKLEVNDKLHKILVSYRNKKRLLNSKTNKYIHSASDNTIKQRTLQVRGPLHEETLYGQITNPYTGESNYVTRKPVSSIETEKQIDKVVDKKIQELIREHIAANGGNIKQAMSLPVYMETKSGKNVPIRTVRMTDNAENLIQLRPNENPKLFVASGNNYCIAVYEGENGKRDFETVNFYNAVKKKREGKHIVPFAKDDKKLLFWLKQKDMLVLYNEHPDEIDWENTSDVYNRLYKVVKFNVNGQISLSKHHMSNVNTDKPKEYEQGIVVNTRHSTIKGVKVSVNALGKLIRSSND